MPNGRTKRGWSLGAGPLVAACSVLLTCVALTARYHGILVATVPAPGVETSGSPPRVAVAYLLFLYESLPPSASGSSNDRTVHPVPRAYPRRHEAPADDVTLATQISLNKFDRLVGLAERYDGPIDCAVYLPDAASIAKLDALVREREERGTAFRDRVELHALLERGSEATRYPINRLRNLALFHVETEYFFLADADFMPSRGVRDELRAYFRRARPPERYSTLYVLPAFEVFGIGSDGNLTALSNLDEIPRTKEELVALLPTHRVKTFQAHFPPAHRASRYDDWYRCGSSEEGVARMYPVEYEHSYEPYVIGYKPAIHYFDERFRGYGYNKAYWVEEAYLRGYRFKVICDAFVVHAYHPGRSGRVKDAEAREIANWYKKDYWPARYNYTRGKKLSYTS